MNISYTITGSEEAGTQILLVVNGKAHTITENHPNFEEIRVSLIGSDFFGIEELVNVGASIMAQLSDNVTLVGNTIHYKGQPLYDALSKTVLDLFRSGQDVSSLVNFMERLIVNPDLNSRLQLYEFLNRHTLPITEDGYFLAYKGLLPDFTSVHAGPGFVNGVYYNGHLDNSPGNVLEMLRSEVTNDPDVACATGLHGGAWKYARDFGNVVVEVQIDPADVVSVPKDANFQKLRVSKYKVLRQVTEENENIFIPNEKPDYREDFLECLGDIAENYTRKGRVAHSYRELADRVINEHYEEYGYQLDQEEIDGFYAVAKELDENHKAYKVYRYHIDELLQ